MDHQLLINPRLQLQPQGIRRLAGWNAMNKLCHRSTSQKAFKVALHKYFQQHYLRKEAILDILLTGPGKASANLSLSILALVITIVGE